jgi:hypothetical protein
MLAVIEHSTNFALFAATIVTNHAEDHPTTAKLHTARVMSILTDGCVEEVVEPDPFGEGLEHLEWWPFPPTIATSNNMTTQWHINLLFKV